MTLAHASAAFRFELAVPYDVAAPLFGAKAETQWAPDFVPQFLHPQPGADVEGAVFRTIDSPTESRLWIATAFDLVQGHVQYVTILNTAMITRIDIRLSRLAGERTGVAVCYERTALEPAANDEVLALSRKDPEKAEDWRIAIEASAQRW